MQLQWKGSQILNGLEYLPHYKVTTLIYQQTHQKACKKLIWSYYLVFKYKDP